MNITKLVNYWMTQLTRITEFLTNFTVLKAKLSYFQEQLIKILKLYKIKFYALSGKKLMEGNKSHFILSKPRLESRSTLAGR